MRHYADRIDIHDANVLFLHKARLGALPRAELARICNEWSLVFANDVFVCLARDLARPAPPRIDAYLRYFRPVQHYLTPAAFRRSAQTVYFVHIPKTAGTTAWDAITNPVQAKVYYDSHNSFVANPPGGNDYDIVGGHVFRSAFERASLPGSRIACVLRDPVERFRSAFLHARRRSEDASTFSPTMKLMRELPLRDFLDHPDAKTEANLQLMMLGAPPEETNAEPDNLEFQACALAAIADPNNVIMTASQLGVFVDRVRFLLGLAPFDGALPRLNSLNAADQQGDMAEFESLADRIRSMAAAEYDLFHRVANAAPLPFQRTQQGPSHVPVSELPTPWLALRRLLRPLRR